MFSSDAFAALRVRNYRLYFIGQFISMCGSWLQMVAEGWLVWHITHNPAAVGVVGAVGSAPMFLLTLVGGAVADRVDRRKLLIFTQSMAGLLAALLGWLATHPDLQVWHVAAVAVVLGVVNAFDVPTRQAFVVEMVDREVLMNAIALNSMLFNGARIVGPAIASALVAIPAVGVAGCFFLNAASYIGSITALILMDVKHQARARTENPWEEALGGIRYVFSQPVVLRLLCLLLACGIFGWSLSVLLPPMADTVLKGGAGAYGMLLTANGVGAVLGALFLANIGDSPHKRTFIYVGVAVWAVGLFGFSLSRMVWLSMLFLAFAGIGMILFNATANTVVQTMVPNELRGRVMGIWSLVFAGSTPIGSLQAGELARRFGAPAALEVGALVILAVGTVVYTTSQQARKREALAAGRRVGVGG